MSTGASSENRVWMITGTTSGFGKRLVHLVLARGDYVIATVRDRAKFDVTVSEAEQSRLHVVVMDLKDPAEKIQSAVAEGLAVWGRIDILINNAGWAPKSLIEEASPAYTQAIFQTNLFGVLNVTNAVLPQMRERHAGTVVFLGSRSVWKADTILTGHYLASKAAVHAFAETYAAELAPFNVRVIIAVPGGFRTENIHTFPLSSENHIPAYDELRAAEHAKFQERWQLAPGDPMKFVELLIDVVTGEGKAVGRKVPLYLVLGKPTHDAARQFFGRLEGWMQEWEDVAKDLDFENRPETSSGSGLP